MPALPRLDEALGKAEATLAQYGGLGVAAIRFGRERFAEDTRLRLAYYLRKAKELLAAAQTRALFHTEPMDPRTFFTSKDGMNAARVIYPKVLDELVDLNSWEFDPILGMRSRYYECVATGSIGSAKTTLGLYTLAYQTHVLACLRDPHGLFDLDPSTEIMMILQSAKEDLARIVDFARLRSMYERAPWFKAHFRFDARVREACMFPNRIQVKFVSGSALSALGQNVIGGIIDEINFMQVVEKSKRKIAAGGLYDQAKELYNTIARRRESRFMKLGWVPGMLILSSSSKFPGEFTDVKKAEAARNKRIKVYDKRHWDIAPDGTYGGETWPLLVGDALHQPKIMTEEEAAALSPKLQHLIMRVPVEVRHQFENDLYGAVRDVAGVSTRAIRPFLFDVAALSDCFREDVLSVFEGAEVDFAGKLCRILPERFESPEEPRWVHIDLGLTSDSAGLAIGWCSGFRVMERGPKLSEMLPVIRFDGVLRVKPPPGGGEIEFARLRKIIYTLRSLGLNIMWVSLDSWQSIDTIQIVRNKGYIADILSLDKKPLPYDIARTAIVDRRVEAPYYEHVMLEWAQLERDEKTLKVDHPPNGSKDVADATAGVIYGLTTRRETWARYNMLARMGQFAEQIKRATDERGDVGDDE